MQGIIGTYELVFPGCIRGYYLLGSYTDATSVSISDIDKDRANVLKALEEFMNPVKTPPTAEEIEQAKQRHLAYLLGEDV